VRSVELSPDRRKRAAQIPEQVGQRLARLRLPRELRQGHGPETSYEVKKIDADFFEEE
jgi:restriction endonuclease Mrr